MTLPTNTDRIEKKMLLHAPIHRVWNAIADATAFGDWFGMEFTEPFAAGAVARGRTRGTKCDPSVAAVQEKYAGMPLEMHVERIEPMRLFSFRWHPFPMDTSVDYSHEPMTLVTFELESVEGGTMLILTESGFDALPITRSSDAFEANGEGWDTMVRMIEKYLDARLA